MSVIHYSAYELENMIALIIKYNHSTPYLDGKRLPLVCHENDHKNGATLKDWARSMGIVKAVVCFGKANARAYSDRYNEDCENAALDINWTRVGLIGYGLHSARTQADQMVGTVKGLRYNCPAGMDSDAYEFIIMALTAVA